MIFTPYTFFVPKAKLPKNVEERYDLLYSLFSNLHIQCKEAASDWEITLSSPQNLDYYIDSGLERGLQWWEEGFSIENVPYARKSTHFGKLMLQDTWTLESWVKTYTDTGISCVTILHIDHHSDLMNPFITKGPQGFIHLTSNENFSSFDSTVIANGVRQGTLFQGSFIIPFLHICDTVNLIHITQNHITTGAYHIAPTYSPSPSIFSTNDSVLSIQTHKLSGSQRGTQGESILYQMRDLIDVETILKHNMYPILLHIDMDYFCNRYNRESDWENTSNLYDKSFSQVNDEIRKVGEFISQVSRKHTILHTDVALVPGFFPAEYWQASTDLLGNYLPNM